MNKKKLDKKAMIKEIIFVAKANNICTSGDLLFSLVFKNESELIKICQDLHISTEERCAC